MNQYLQNNSFTIIAILVLIIFILMGVMIFILFKLLTRSRNEISEMPSSDQYSHYKNITKKNDFTKSNPAPVVEKYYCIHHKDAPSVAACLICEEVFCVDCLVDHESMHFCKEHFRTFASYKWKQITDVRTTPDTPEDGLYIYNFKRDIWLEKNIPSFVMTHYKINIENDYIESFIQLNVREDDVEKLTNEILKYKALD
jgi:hypothetical protein